MSAPCLSRPLLSAGPLQTLSREAGLAKPEPGLSEKGKGWNGSGQLKQNQRWRREKPAAALAFGAEARRDSGEAPRRERVSGSRAADDELRCEDAGHPQLPAGAGRRRAENSELTYILV